MTKRIYIFAAILVSVGLLFASIGPVVATDELWVETYGGSDYDQFDGMVALADGGFAMAGGYLEPGEEYMDMWLVRADSTGSLIWQERYTEPSHLAELAYSMIEVSTGGFLLAGQADGGTGWIVRTDNGGGMVWNSTFSFIGSQIPKSCFECSDGGFVLAGEEFLMKVDSDGNHLWNRTYETANAPEFGLNNIHDVIETDAGNFVMTGWTSSLGAGEWDVWLLKTNANGVEYWNTTFGGVEYDRGYSVIEVSTGGYAIIGSVQEPDAGTFAWLIRVDSTGDLLWNQTYVESDSLSTPQCEGRDVVECSDGGFAISGDISGIEGGSEILLVRTDSNGDYSWHKYYGGPGDDYGKVVAELASGGFAVAGETRDEMATTSDGILVVFEDSAPAGPPPDYTLVIVGGAAVVVILVIVLFIRRR